MNAIARSDAQRPPGHGVPAWALALPLVVVLVATAVGVAMVIGDRSSNAVWVAPGHASVGAPAPNFTSNDLQGKKVSLSDFASRPVLLTFWATWCTVCKDELPALQTLEQRYASSGFAVLAVNYRETNNDRMRQYLAGINVTLQSVIDPGASIAAAYGVDVGLPVNVLVDKAGRVARIMVGEQPIATIESAVAQVVAPAA
ncbi:MAG: cytochrome c biosis protein CcmG, thiol:disulfide interchange protein DsbE [Chloroflexota bacterium]|nr:cytochrome c biosis protein CcmG, thiol:disulfide interchange protein DsbE [Chloroflexota bacterium]